MTRWPPFRSDGPIFPLGGFPLPPLSPDPALRLPSALPADLAAWRAAHPRASFHEIETQVDLLLARLRAQLLPDTALAHPPAEWVAQPPAAPPRWPPCAHPLQPRGHPSPTVRRHQDQPGILSRQYAVCPAWDGGFFPPLTN